ncbi:mechanosensitive ion channel family protein [Thermomicrobium roseum]|uniref:Mechanosensitive ion channel n=1 Tax=Thermomicrobium roseum (strain ATCC 27502 / DSM 5159 / P-2) TaxID=309801 RepID=B9L2T9_THERP|nr:mechanosensitive ion channel family protein [Thermomicrobium roseum]ACM06175.1 mechanosensitive ion channel [Thermomicrobium roseum DSM 5159]
MIDRWADRLGTLLEPGIRAVIILLLAWLAVRVARLVIRRGVARLLSSRRATDREFATRLRTLTSLAESATRLIVWILAGLTILAVFGVPIGPLLASAGVAGLAVGLGAQTLIRDIIGGIFIVLEDQFHVGDVITVNAISGQVESLTLRYTVLRALDGAYVVVPNGEIRIVQNLSRDWARAVIDVAVTPEEDVDRVVAVLRDLLAGLPNDPVLGPLVLEPGEVLGVEAIAPQQATVRLAVKTRPLEQWRVARELRRRILLALREAGVSVPYPRTVTIIQPPDSAEPSLS